MRPLCILIPILASGCSGGDEGEGDTTPSSETVGCGYDNLPQILSGDPVDVVIPDGREGALEDVLIGVWQTTWSYEPDLAEPLYALSNENTDTRYAIPDLSTFIYCQDVAVDADGANESALSLEGDKLAIAGPGYTATWWTADTMV